MTTPEPEPPKPRPPMTKPSPSNLDDVLRQVNEIQAQLRREREAKKP